MQMYLTPAWSELDPGPVVFNTESVLHYGVKKNLRPLHEEFIDIHGESFDRLAHCREIIL